MPESLDLGPYYATVWHRHSSENGPNLAIVALIRMPRAVPAPQLVESALCCRAIAGAVLAVKVHFPVPSDFDESRIPTWPPRASRWRGPASCDQHCSARGGRPPPTFRRVSGAAIGKLWARTGRICGPRKLGIGQRLIPLLARGRRREAGPSAGQVSCEPPAERGLFRVPALRKIGRTRRLAKDEEGAFRADQFQLDSCLTCSALFSRASLEL
jgi:hypothetical protein